MSRRHTNNLMQGKLINFGVKYGNQENITKSRMDKQHGKRVRRTRRRIKSENTHKFTQNNTKISNWKTPDHDGIHRFCFNKFTSIHERLALEMNRCQKEADVTEWMTKGKTILIQKDLLKGTTPNNYRPITCLHIMWKILTAQIREEI